MFYRIFRIFSRIALKTYFRNIHFTGSEKIPEGEPVLLVSNHVNGLIDPLFFIAHFRRHIYITAKNVLRENPLLKFLFNNLDVIMFHRPQDSENGSKARENVKSIRRCVEVLSKNEALCIFPEGKSHSESRMIEFKHGAARIAYDFLKKMKQDLIIVPAGLNFMDKDKFRSDAWVRFGAPFSLMEWKNANPEKGIQDLTNEMARRIEAVTLNFDNRREFWGLRWAAELISTGAADPVPLDRFEPSLKGHIELVENLQEAYLKGSKERMDDILAIAKEVQLFQRELRRLGIIPAEVFLSLHWGQAAFFILRELEIFLIGMPMALAAWLFYILPFSLTRAIAVKFSRSKDHWATFAIYPGFIIFPVICCLELLLLWYLLPFYVWVIFIICLPYISYYLLNYLDRAGGALRRARTFILMTFLPHIRKRLMARGRNIIEKIQDMYLSIVKETR